MAEPAPSAETVPEHQDRALFGLFGKKKEEEGKHEDHIKPAASTHTQTHDPHLYPTNPPHGAAVNQQHAQGYGHTAGEAEKQQHTGLLGKLHRSNSSSSSSSSSDEEGEKKKKGERKKKGLKDKLKEKLPGGHEGEKGEKGHGHEGEKKGEKGHGHEGEKKGEKGHGHEGEKKGEKGHGHEGEKKGEKGHGHEGEGEKKGLVDKIKDKLPGHHDKE